MVEEESREQLEEIINNEEPVKEAIIPLMLSKQFLHRCVHVFCHAADLRGSADQTRKKMIRKGPKGNN